MIDTSEVLFQSDQANLSKWLAEDVVTDSVATFVEGPGLKKLGLRFDSDELRLALNDVMERTDMAGDIEAGFGVIPLTRRPGTEGATDNDLSGRHWLRADERYVEEPREDLVDEASFTEFIPDYADTYFAHVHNELTKRVPIGRMRLSSKSLYNCNSWHRDPEPRIHVPIVSNPGSLFVINHHVTHLPADGSVYFTDTRGYHMAMNGGFDHRVHIVAVIPN